MEQSSNKTIMCSVFFLDIVGYSKRSVTGQISLKERFNAYLSAAIRDVPLSDRIILDTGDGAAINFMGDVEDALKAALSMRSSMLQEDPHIEPPLLVRMGVNLGPVRLIRDINGQPNIVGDGINVAQRVMGFADASQILVSRSYFDAVSRLSPQYAGMFHYQGSRTDKHVREHEVYAIGYPGDKTTRPFTVQDGAEKKAGRLARLTTPIVHSFTRMMKKMDTRLESALEYFEKIDPKRRPWYVAAAGVPLVLLFSFGVKTMFREELIPVKPYVPVVRAPRVVNPTVVSASGVVDAVPKVKITKPNTTTGTTKSKVMHFKPQPPTPITKRKLTDQEIAAIAANRATNKLLGFSFGDGEVSRGKLALSCLEGSLLFVDGAQKGKVTTGDLVIDVSPGKHVVIVMLPNQKLFTQSVIVPSGKMLKIRPNLCN